MQQGPDEAKYTDTNPACDITWNSIRWFIQRAQTRTESIQSIKHGFALLFLFLPSCAYVSIMTGITENSEGIKFYLIDRQIGN